MPKDKIHQVEDHRIERAVLVGLVTKKQSEQQLKEYLDELEFLAETAGAQTEEKFWQKLDHPEKRTYVGSGKLAEIKTFVKAYDIDMVIFDDEITPSQQRNIEKELKCKVLDRSMLILDIFAQRAQTLQAKTQVELAQLQYLLPRLKGMWQHLDRVKGGIGMKGAGEKEIETDRRIAKQNIAKLKAKLETIDKQNLTQRKNRDGMIRVSLVGYTNVGKSTLMRALSKEDVFAENKLFATLDTTVRKVVLNHVPFLLSDTVGFIRKLPHHLVESFKSTLDEALESDILLHVVDIAHPNFEDQFNVVNETLQELKAENKTQIIIFNKIDLYRERHFDEHLPEEIRKELLQELKQSWMAKSNNEAVFISAETGENLDELRDIMYVHIKKLYLDRYPYKASYLTDY
ncbi:GTPase HflX [Chitinophagales bacterium]|jgi:GTP-binding protein HflX|nr:GTPase HflX [Chitinophagales bacterium]